MKKDHIRDYAVEAFRYYSSCGRLSHEDFKKKAYNELDYALIQSRTFVSNTRTNNKRTKSNVENTVLKFEYEKLKINGQILDIIAVEQTLEEFEKSNKSFINRAVEIVYFTNPDESLKKNCISNRVVRASLEIPASESTIYLLLKTARITFAKYRGLRLM